MALKDLFKSKSARMKPDPRIRWFGKLPTYPDYYSSRADEEWAVEFNDWVLKGFEQYRSRLVGERKSVGKLPLSGCAIRLPKSGMTAFTSFLDYGGDMRGRPFPMCFYVGVPTEQWPGPTSDHLSGASRAIRDLLALRREVARFLNSPGRLESVFGDREVDLDGIDAKTSDTSWLAAGKQIKLTDWFEQVRGCIKAGSSGTWLRLATAWGENLARHDSKDFEPTLRFPLAMRLSPDAQIAGWIRWLESRLDLTRRSLSLIVTGEPDHQAGHLTVIARHVVADDFLLLAPLPNPPPYLDDLSVVEASVALDDTMSGSEGPTLLAGENGTWADFARHGAAVA